VQTLVGAPQAHQSLTVGEASNPRSSASLLEIADTLGHRTLSMVKRYAHLAQSHKVSVIEKMAIERGL
jgi:hypothetical protein